MKLDLADAQRLKRFALSYAKAYMERSWAGRLDDQVERDQVEEDFQKARSALYSAIDRLTK